MNESETSPAIEFLQKNGVEFQKCVYEYEEKGGTKRSSEKLGVDEHCVIKTLVFEDNTRRPFIVLQHGDRLVDLKLLADATGCKKARPCEPEKATLVTGYLVGGTSPFGTRESVPIYAEGTIFDLPLIYINGGKRGMLVRINPAEIARVLSVALISVATVR